ncbi:response regulator [Brevundimonas sp.]|uniref:response regulator n=1 Tax=Brevundimonas sp. TaxID=1871086 RepID=UPI002E147E95|nr:response regulator [Brevundimonas sp.]
MFAVDRRMLARLEPVVRRVLIVDHNAHAARLIAELLKTLGAREVVVEGEARPAMRAAATLDPGLIFTERLGPNLDGEEFARAVRRSDMSCRRAPIIMVTAEATASSIKGARDVGVHEYLRKPFTSADLMKRIENVALKPRDWIEGVAYVGPDRRRFNSGEYAGPTKRKSDKPTSAAQAVADAKDQAMRILAAALDQFDADPAQAVRAVREQAVQLKAIGMKASDTRLVVAVGALEVSLASGPATKATLAAPIGALLAMHQGAGEALRRAG